MLRNMDEAGFSRDREWPALREGISAITPWRRPGARWHVHLPVTDEVRAWAAAFHPVLDRFTDLQVVPEEFLHCTLAWATAPAAMLTRLLPGTDDVGAALGEQVALWLRLTRDEYISRIGSFPQEVPVCGLGWALGGPVLVLDTDAAGPVREAAARGVRGIAGDTAMVGWPEPGWRPVVALAYATTTWTPDEVAGLNSALHEVAGDLPLPAPLPAKQLLVCSQDTFAPDGLHWDQARLVGAADNLGPSAGTPLGL
jgi:hypothetical protein